MKKILLDTNMFIYIADNKIIEEKVLELTKMLYDSDDYKIVIHPDTKKEIEKFRNKKEKDIFKSKIAIYKEIKDAPVADASFNQIVGCKNSHDVIDNNILFAVKRNCVDYLITNDKALVKKGKKVGLEKRVLSIDEALNVFRPVDEPSVSNPPFIEKCYLYNLNIDDPFFDSLKVDYKGFDKWFEKKQKTEAFAYVTYKEKKLTSFLMLKIEDEKEDYSYMIHPLTPKKRLKISTLKVSDTGKKIGESFIKIIMEYALNNNVDEIYITVFLKQKELIDLLQVYGFEKETYFYTENSNGKKEKEYVFVKKAKPVEESYPFISLDNRKVFLVPIQEKYHNILFQESEKNIQLSFEDSEGLNTSSNSIKKAYISDSKINKITPGSILLFYASGVKKAITSLGVVDATFTNFKDYNDMYSIVKKRTVFNEDELKKTFAPNKLVILFRLYYSFSNYATYEFLKKNNIILGPIQTITEIKKDKAAKLNLIFEECKFEVEKYIIS